MTRRTLSGTILLAPANGRIPGEHERQLLERPEGLHHRPYGIQRQLAVAVAAASVCGSRRLFPATSDITDGTGHTLVTAYAVKRPDGQWAVMLINKDQENNHRIHIEFTGSTGSPAQFSGPLEESVFGRAQYHWNPPQRDFNAHLPQASDKTEKIYHGGSADPDGPIVRKQVPAGKEFDLPAASVVVLRGKL